MAHAAFLHESIRLFWKEICFGNKKAMEHSVLEIIKDASYRIDSYKQ